jgi:predicted butyrate kinase (DUF1464 family)
VPPPDVPGWERRASGWLFDLCPADLRAYDVLRRHPAALAYVAVGQVSAALAAVQVSLSNARAELRDALPPEAVTEAVEALQRERARLERAARATALVQEALAGTRYRPRL